MFGECRKSTTNDQETNVIDEIQYLRIVNFNQSNNENVWTDYWPNNDEFNGKIHNRLISTGIENLLTNTKCETVSNVLAMVNKKNEFNEHHVPDRYYRHLTNVKQENNLDRYRTYSSINSSTTATAKRKHFGDRLIPIKFRSVSSNENVHSNSRNRFSCANQHWHHQYNHRESVSSKHYHPHHHHHHCQHQQYHQKSIHPTHSHYYCTKEIWCTPTIGPNAIAFQPIIRAGKRIFLNIYNVKNGNGQICQNLLNIIGQVLLYVKCLGLSPIMNYWWYMILAKIIIIINLFFIQPITTTSTITNGNHHHHKDDIHQQPPASPPTASAQPPPPPPQAQHLRTKTLFIAGFFPTSRDIPQGAIGRGVLPAVRLALQHVNESPLFNKYRLDLVWNNTKVS